MHSLMARSVVRTRQDQIPEFPKLTMTVSKQQVALAWPFRSSRLDFDSELM
jgi:hypothetical protein